jgi:DNA-binding transcriptional LysR family regulator
VAPRFREIEQELDALTMLRDRPAGNVRITAAEHAALSVLQPALARILPRYPDVTVEIVVDYGLTDIVAERFDAGVRLGEQVAKDIIAVPIGPPMRMAVVGAPSYFARHARPETPRDLTDHNCINIRLPTYGGLFAWEFDHGGREVRVRVEGQVIVNHAGLRLASVLGGLGLAYLPEDQILDHVAQGRLIRVLEDWCEPFPGYHLYYPSRHHASSAFGVVVEALRYRGG